MRKYEPFAPPALEYEPGVSLNVPDSCSLAVEGATGAAGGVPTTRFFLRLAFLCLVVFFLVTQRLAAPMPLSTAGPATETMAATTIATTRRSAQRLIGPRPAGATRR